MADLFPLLILWLIVGFVVGYAATANGKDFLPWFIYGYLVFPVAFVHLIVSKTHRSANRIALNQRSRQPWMEPREREWDHHRKQQLIEGIEALNEKAASGRPANEAVTNEQPLTRRDFQMSLLALRHGSRSKPTTPISFANGPKIAVLLRPASVPAPNCGRAARPWPNAPQARFRPGP